MNKARISKREISNSQGTQSYMRSLTRRDVESKRREDTKRKKDLESRLLDPSLTNKKKRAHLQKELDKLNRSLAAEKNSGRQAKKKLKSPRTVQANGKGKMAVKRKSPRARPSKSPGARPSNASASNASARNASASSVSASSVSASNASASNACTSNACASNASASNARPSNARPSNASNARPSNDSDIVRKAPSKTKKRRKCGKTKGGSGKSKSTRKSCSGMKPRNKPKRRRRNKPNQSKGKCSATF